ncbi:protein translocase subunit SecD [Breoghania sp.]|uniref:protein translocase subunit SecD n=1 Tax=Breoghania sp. TaxID=2065378 RepID=UPI002616B28E|nr:protein translocase subunit SecD [Breoghania sp.]MDJ0929618.1 protein translocase subunit SecD [Breoghania sp.]
MLYFARWKVVLIALLVILGAMFTVPNFFTREEVASWPEWVPGRQLVLGLDLQGGAYLLYEVDRESYQKKRLQSLVGEIRNALRKSEPRIGYTGLGVKGDDSVELRLRDTARIADARERLKDLVNPLDASLFSGSQVNEFSFDISDDGQVRFAFSEEGLAQRIHSVVDQSIEVIRRRVDQLGTTEPSIQRQGENRILVEAPGLDDPEHLKTLIGQTAQMTFHLVNVNANVQQAIQTRPPAGGLLVYSTDDPPVLYLIEEEPLLTGEDLDDSQATFDQRSNEPVVTFRFNTAGARKFAKVTKQNVGRPFAIVLDNEVISAPVIREPILGGSGQISGNFTVESANDLSILLRAGALPAQLTIVQERTVGPSLGADSVEAGKIASLVGIFAVAIFMIMAYGLFGILADVALFVNMVLIFGALSFLGATLTLPGIAGIVLTVGMAVDANVLIYERIREESRNGRSVVSSLDAGFSRALGTILDANITTLIAAVILFYLGSGPIRGFAVTLAIGIVTTVFSAFTFTRFLVSLWLRGRRPSKLPI